MVALAMELRFPDQIEAQHHEQVGTCEVTPLIYNW